MENRTRVGVGIMIFKENKILLGRRKGSHGAGEYSFPGGHLEYMESFQNCANREIREECSEMFQIRDIGFLYIANVGKYAPKHYVHIGLVAHWKSGEPINTEPNKSEEWNWYNFGSPPEPLFEFCKLSIETCRTGKTYYDLEEAIKSSQ